MAKDKPPTDPANPDPPPAHAFDPEALPTQGQFFALMEKLTEAIKASGMSPDALKDILSETGKVNAELARKARWPENADHPGISAFSYPEGEVARPKPKLARDTYFCGMREQEERLTPGEIEAYNAISEPRECRNGAWRAVIRKSSSVGGRQELQIFVPKDTVDQRMLLPSLHLILHELNGGPSTEDIMSLVKQVESLKALLASKGATASELEAAMLAK